jgi:phage terminase small subunit
MTAPKRKAKTSPGKTAGKGTARTKAGHPAGSAEQRIKLFVEALLSNGENVTQAALAAGFSPKSAASQGSRLLKNVKVQQILDSRRAELLGKSQLTTERVLESVAQALFFDPRKLYRDDGTLKPIQELDDGTAMALAGLEIVEEYGPATDTELEPQPHGGGLKRSHGRRVVTGYTAKVKWLDKNAAREQAAKMLGLYGADNRQRIDPIADLLAELMKRQSAPPVTEQEAG